MARLLSFDIAKALCIILVVAGHFRPEYAPDWYLHIWKWIYSFHMPLFMFASGYIYIAFKKEESYLSFINKKLKRLMVPYIVVSVIIISIKLLTQNGNYVENPVVPMSFITMLYKPEAGYFLWFVWALFLYFLIIPFFKTKMSRFCLFALAIIFHYVNFENTTIFALHESKRMFLWFMLGVICYDCGVVIILQRLGKHWNAMLQGTVVILFTLISLFGMGHSQMVLLMPWLGIACVMIISYRIVKYQQTTWMKFLVSLSTASYIVYLLHTTFEGFCKAVLHKVPIVFSNPNIQFCFEAVAVILCGLTIPMMLYYFVLCKFKWARVLFGIR